VDTDEMLGEWQRAGLEAQQGGLSRPLSLAPSGVPKDLDLNNGRLQWERGAEWRKTKSHPDLLLAFIRLADASDDDVAAFSRDHGLLFLCRQHGLPLSHSRVLIAVGAEMSQCDVPGGRRPYVRTDDVRRWARQFRAVMNVAARLHNGKPAAELDWAVLDVEPPSTGIDHRWRTVDLSPEERVRQGREILAQLIDAWLDFGAVRFTFEWGDRPNFGITVAGVFGALAAQLMFAVARSNGLAVCMGCGLPYAPTQKPKAGKRNYCPGCRSTARFRDAKRTQRTRKRSEP
jgi:hypothetical protein